MSDAPRRVARVLIDSPLPQLDRLFDYVVPDVLREAALPGVRVKVPLRTVGRTVEGYLVELGDETDGDRPLSELEDVVSPVEVLPERLHAHARRVADRAAGSASDVLRLVIPKRMVRAEKAWAASGPPDVPVVSAESLAWARETTAAYPDLEGAVENGERLAVDAPPRPAEDVPAWSELLAALAVLTLARGKSAVE